MLNSTIYQDCSWIIFVPVTLAYLFLTLLFRRHPSRLALKVICR